jgi:nucleoside-diphosphate-sugar epimerase
MQEIGNSAQGKSMNMEELNAFIVRAKSATYVGDGEHVSSCRPGSHDLRFEEDKWAYHDSYFGGSDFICEEVVYFEGTPVWALNYYGRILHTDLISAAQAGQMIKASLSRMYQEDRFLGGYEYTERDFTYVDDIVEANVSAAVRGVPGRVYNVGGGSRVSINQVLELIGRLCGRRPRVVSSGTQKGDMRHTYADISLARADLGFEPRVGLEQGLAAERAWLADIL